MDTRDPEGVPNYGIAREVERVFNLSEDVASGLRRCKQCDSLDAPKYAYIEHYDHRGDYDFVVPFCSALCAKVWISRNREGIEVNGIDKLDNEVHKVRDDLLFAGLSADTDLRMLDVINRLPLYGVMGFIETCLKHVESMHKGLPEILALISGWRAFYIRIPYDDLRTVWPTIVDIAQIDAPLACLLTRPPRNAAFYIAQWCRDVAARYADKNFVDSGCLGDNFVLKRAVVDMEGAWQYKAVIGIEEKNIRGREEAS